MAASGVSIELSGPIFEKGAGKKLDKATMDGLEECAKELTANVQSQLYLYHGWKTGVLKGSIQYRRYDSLGSVIVGSNVIRGGSPLVYAYWVETGKRRGRQTRFPGYHMFKNTYNKFNRNFRSCERIIHRKLIGALD